MLFKKCYKKVNFFIILGNFSIKYQILQLMKGKILELSLHTYGCRVV